jgi:hypothetical protein
MAAVAWVCALCVIAVLSAACGAAPPPRPVVTTASPTKRPALCAPRYTAWLFGTVHAADRRLAAELQAVQAAEQSRDASALRSAMGPLMPTALALATQPMPRCADTAGIYIDLVDDVYQAGDEAHTAKGLSGLLRAANLMQLAVKVEYRLTGEVTRAVGREQCPRARGLSQPPLSWPPC